MNLNILLKEIVRNITNLPLKDEKDILEFIEHEEWGLARISSRNNMQCN
ncbi:hypothetical protein NSQ61_14615 [Aeribacillus sp. FSL K6-1121]|jgi:hypothetical protein|nr:hypothetical protein [Aeribacillus pallidus]